MKVFVTGVCGQLGHDVVNELISRGHEAVGSDITDKYEGADDGSAVVTAPYEQLAVNSEGTKNIAQACKELDCKMIYISTDYVFDGEGTEPWQPDCKEYAPLCVYGDSKLKGELAVSGILDKYFIVRIAWVFGRNGSNFIKTMLKVGKKYDTVRVVNDQIGTPTYTFDLAKLLADMCESDKYGYSDT